MQQRIIFPRGDGGISIIIPVASCGLSIEQIARKDVPQGMPYKIVDAATIPEDRTFREAWEADFSAPDGHGDPASCWTEWQAQQAEQEQAA